MFINKGKLLSEQVKATLLTVFGGASGIFWSIGIALFIASLINGDPEAVSNFMVSVILCAGGFLLLWLGLRKLKLVRNAKRYSSAMAVAQVKTIEALAQNVAQDGRIVKKNLDKMIEMGLIEKITINELENTIIYPRVAFQGPAMTAARCASCGGVTQVPAGSAGICAYCGSKVKG